MEVSFHALLNLLPSRIDRFTSGDRAPVVHLCGGWVGPEGSLDVSEETAMEAQGYCEMSVIFSQTETCCYSMTGAC